MIGWVNMLMLAGLGALAIPVLIHLLRNRRFESADLGSLRFLRQVVRESSKWRRVRNLLLLFLRLLVILLLVLLFARPYLAQPGAAADRDTDMVLLLDASGSTRGKLLGRSLWQGVRDAGRDVRATMSESAQLTMALFADEVLAVEEDLVSDPPAGAGTDYATAMRWAAARLRASTAAYREVLLVTDLQKSGLPALPLQDWPADVPVRIRPLPAAGAFNIAIGAVHCLTPVPEESARFSVRLVCSGDVPDRPLDLRMRIQGAEEWRRTVLPQTQEVVFSWESPPRGICRGTAQVSATDGWPEDDTLEFAFELRHPLPIAVLDSTKPQPAPERASYFLTTALSNERDGEGRACYGLTVSADLSAESTPQAVIAAQPATADREALERLARRVRAGTGLLIFLGEWTDPAAAAAWQEAGLLPLSLSWTAVPVPERLSEWDASHPILQAFGSAETGALDRIVFRDAFRIDADPATAVIGSLAGGRPAILAGSRGAGRIVVVTNPCSRAWTDWPTESIYLPLIREMTAYVARLGDRQDRLATRQASVLHERSPGVYEGEQPEVVFPHPEEALVERCSEAEFRIALGIGPAPESPLETTDATLPAGRERGHELWRWLALALAAILFIESLTADWPRRQRGRQRESAAGT